MMNMRSLCRALGALSLLSMSAHAADLAPDDPHGLFGSLSGSYVLPSLNDDWQIFAGPYEQRGLGDGFLLKGLAGYRWDAWDAALALQYGDFSKGKASDSLNGAGDLQARMWAVDIQAGYNTTAGDSDLRLSMGLRYAAWNNDVHYHSEHINHDFRGLGPMLRADLSKPLGDSSTLEAGLGASLLFGEIKTNADPGWICTQCTNRNTTAFSLDGHVGVGFNLAATRAVLGWQAQWWDNVNVGITDATGFGKNEGTSSYFQTGPYLEMKF